MRLAKPADDLQPIRVDVEQHQLVDRQTLAMREKPFDELRRVGAASATTAIFTPTSAHPTRKWSGIVREVAR